MIVENLNSVFNFGKYKGEVIKEVALKDPFYIEWLCENVDLFVITNDTIDEISDYCLSIFFDDPNKYLNETGDFVTTYEVQYLNYKGIELTVGSLTNEEFEINTLKERGVIDKYEISLQKRLLDVIQPRGNHISLAGSRKVFNGEECKKNLIERGNK